MAKITKYKTLKKLTTRLRDDLNNNSLVLIYAYNGIGKTRISMSFKDSGKKQTTAKLTANGDVLTFNGDHLVFNDISKDTLYFNAFTEDLFTWHNDLENDDERYLTLNQQSKFFDGFKDLALEAKISNYLNNYTDFDFKIDYQQWRITFSKKNILNPEYRKNSKNSQYIDVDNIKISRGEESIFIWCIFLAIMELAIDGDESYKWVKYFYIDDPISSLDDNNAVAVAVDLATLLKNKNNQIKTIISTHHSLFFNIMFNECRKLTNKQYFLSRESDTYSLQNTGESPSFYHIAILAELKKASDSNKLYTYHFNMLRNILEKTAVFFGHEGFSKCVRHTNKVLHARALNIFSHSKYSIYEPMEMNNETKELFTQILNNFLDDYKFNL